MNSFFHTFHRSFKFLFAFVPLPTLPPELRDTQTLLLNIAWCSDMGWTSWASLLCANLDWTDRSPSCSSLTILRRAPRHVAALCIVSIFDASFCILSASLLFTFHNVLQFFPVKPQFARLILHRRWSQRGIWHQDSFPPWLMACGKTVWSFSHRNYLPLISIKFRPSFSHYLPSFLLRSFGMFFFFSTPPCKSIAHGHFLFTLVLSLACLFPLHSCVEPR